MAKLLLSNRPDKFKDIAVSEHTKEQTTYGDLREKVADLATQFYIRNWQQGQVIAVFLPMGLPFYVTRLAAAQLGITLTIGTAVEFHSDMSADPTLSAYQLEKQIRDSGASYLITDVSLMPIVREVMASVRSVTELFVLNREEDIGVDKEENTKCGKGYMRYYCCLHFVKLVDTQKKLNTNLFLPSHQAGASFQVGKSLLIPPCA